MQADHRRRLIKGSLSLGSSTTIQMVFGFLAVTIAARNISEDQFGAYFLLLALVILLEVIGNAGLQLSAAKFIASASDDHERNSIVNNILTFRILTVIAVVIVAIVAKPLFLVLFPDPFLAMLYVFVPILFAVRLSETTLTYIMQGFHLYSEMALVQLVISGLNLGLVILALLVFDLGISGFIMASVISLFVGGTLRLRMIPGARKFSLEKEITRKIFHFGLPLQGNDLLTYIIQRVDILILALVMGPVQIAYLEVASRIPNYFRRLYQSIQFTYFPQMAELLSEQRGDEAEALINNLLRIASFLALFATLVFWLFQVEIITLIFSDKYFESGQALGLLMVVASISMVSMILDTGFVAAGRPAYLLIVNLVMALAIVAGNLSLIPLFGFMGAVYAKLGAELIGNPVSFLYLRRGNIAARASEFLKPALLFAIAVLIYGVAGTDTLIMRGTVIILFTSSSLIFSLISIDDIRIFLAALRRSAPRPALQEQAKS